MLARQLEELTLNAWPAAESLLFDGWMLCFSGGYTRRANSIHALYPSSMPLEAKISTCEATYATRGRETVFKVTSSAQDADLDRKLDDLGYQSAALTSVQTVNLSDLPSAVSAATVGPGVFRSDSSQSSPSARSTTAEIDIAVVLSTALDDAWVAALNRLTVVPEHLQLSERLLLERIVPPHAFASVALDGQVVALGLAVVERGHVGLYDIVVESHHRKRGLAHRLCTSLLAWGRQQGAATGYLAVMADNAPALALYARLGFREVYRYWYRHKPYSKR